MKNNKSELIMIVDRSGSMKNIKQSTERGMADLIDKQKKVYGECYVSLYEFDDEYNPVYEYKNINDVQEYNLVPRRWTALLDAIGFTIDSVGKRLSNTPEYERPEDVIFVVLTDGEENRSKEFTQAQIKEMVEHQQNKYNWKFLFVGSNQNAVLNGAKYGFLPKFSISYSNNDGGVKGVFDSVSCATTSLRSSFKDYTFTAEDRKKSLVED